MNYVVKSKKVNIKDRNTYFSPNKILVWKLDNKCKRNAQYCLLSMAIKNL